MTPPLTEVLRDAILMMQALHGVGYLHINFSCIYSTGMTEELQEAQVKRWKFNFWRFSFVLRLVLTIRVCLPGNRYVRMEDDVYRNHCNYSYSV